MILPLVGAAVAHADPAIADAAQSGDLKTVRALLRQTVDVNAPQRDGMTALHWAVQRNDLAMTDLLLGAGADWKAANRTGVKPIYLAAENGSAELIA